MTKSEKIVFLLRHGMFLSVTPILTNPMEPRGFRVSVSTDLNGLHTVQREIHRTDPGVGEVIVDTILELAGKHHELWWTLERYEG